MSFVVCLLLPFKARHTMHTRILQELFSFDDNGIGNMIKSSLCFCLATQKQKPLYRFYHSPHTCSESDTLPSLYTAHTHNRTSIIIIIYYDFTRAGQRERARVSEREMLMWLRCEISSTSATTGKKRELERSAHFIYGFSKEKETFVHECCLCSLLAMKHTHCIFHYRICRRRI